MGGQQFRRDALLIDMRSLNRVRRFNAEKGTVEVEAGIQWPGLFDALADLQRGAKHPWVIRQKQTGADYLTLGGAIAANVHGRGLAMRPMIDDIESLRVLCADGRVRHCSRTREAGLFRLVVGGYGLFGIVLRVELRLTRQQILRREVEVISRGELRARFEKAAAEGALYGDFQFSCDEKSGDLLNRGVFACYFPSETEEVPDGQDFLTPERWKELIYLAHFDKARAFETYSEHYRKTHGQLYHSDRMQLAAYLDSYHAEIDRRCGASCPGSEMITEIYVPRDALEGFLAASADYIRRAGANLIYGTVRLIRRDSESFLAWAKADFACVIFNLHVDHDAAGIGSAGVHFRELIRLALDRGGSFYLTYHRFASRAQLLAAYPQLPAFLAAKRTWDPKEVFQSEWYAHYREMFNEEIEELVQGSVAATR